MAEQQTTDTGNQQGRAPVGNDVSNYGLEEDPDYALLQQAKADAEAEENGVLHRTTEIPEEGDAPQNADYGSWTGRAPAEGEQQGQQTYEPTKTAEGQQGEQGKPDQIMVPKARLDEALHKADEASRQATYLQGQLEAYARYMPQGSQQSGQSSQPSGQQQPQQDLQAQIQQERDRKQSAADKYDSGEISLKEYEQVRDEVDDKIWGIRQQAQQSQQRRPASEWGPADEKVLEDHLEQLASNHPYVDVMTQQDYDRLQRIAYAEAEAEGRPIQAGARGTMDLRERVARLTDHYGPQWYPNAEVKSGSQPSNQQQRQAQGPNLSPQAQARQDKNALQERLPPDPNEIGTGAQGSQVPSEGQIAQMTDDEIQALPPEIRQRYL
jgi:hypothetical protein